MSSPHCPAPLPDALRAEAQAVCETILAYLLRCREQRPGEYYGSFWSEKAYHGPLLNYHAGGSHPTAPPAARLALRPPATSATIRHAPGR